MSRAERRALVERAVPAVPVSRQCRLLSVSRASVYRRPTEIGEEDCTIMALIDRQYLVRPYYGSRRMAAWLATQGHVVNRKRVRRVMRLAGLVAIYQRPNTSKPAPAHKIYPYLLGGISIERVNQVWCSDVTYIPMAKGFLYLVVIMDWVSRAVLAWRLSNTLGAEFCIEALDEALSRHGRPEIFNTDQGSQFTSDDFTGTLECHKVTISMDGKGRYMDNIFVERLWRSLKYEEVYLNAYASVAEAKAGIGSWLDFYNEERQHQSLGYCTPRQAYEAECSWIGGRSASPTGYAFAHIPTGTTTNQRFDVDEEGDRSDAMTVATSATGAGTKIGRATPQKAAPAVSRSRSISNALAETINGLYKAEVIHRRGPWRSFEAVEFATLEWVDWFNNRRLLEAPSATSAAEAEQRYHAMLEQPAMTAKSKPNGLRQSRDGSA